MPLADLRTICDPQSIAELHAVVLAPSFDGADAITPAALCAGVTLGAMSALCLYDQDGQPAAAAIGEYFPGQSATLLAYLAVRPDVRGGGLGSIIYRAFLDAARASGPQMVFAEIEDPAVYAPDPLCGDPVARARFYARHGARWLDVPYFLPAMSPGTEREDGALLLACHVDRRFRSGEAFIAPESLAQFLRANIETCERRPATDLQARTLLRSVQAREACLLRPIPGVRSALRPAA